MQNKPNKIRYFPFYTMGPTQSVTSEETIIINYGYNAYGPIYIM